MKRKNKGSKITLSPKYLAAIKSIRKEFKCTFEQAEDILKEKTGLQLWKEKNTKV
jgi:hypothetical protein